MGQPEVQRSWLLLAQDPELKARQDKLAKTVQVQMMDFRVNSPDKVAKCASGLIQLFDNILRNPQEQKYRKVRFFTPMLLEQTIRLEQHFAAKVHIPCQSMRFAQVRATNPKFSRDILAATKQTEEFLLAAGWHTMVRQSLSKCASAKLCFIMPLWRY